MVASLFAYSLALWMGLYLLSRGFSNPLFRFTAAGLLAYALALGGEALRTQATSAEQAASLAGLTWPLLFLPAVFWLAAMILLWPEGDALRMRLQPYLGPLTVAVSALLYVIATGSAYTFTYDGSGPGPGPGYGFFAAAMALIFLLALGNALRAWHMTQFSRRIVGLVAMATLFFGLGLGLLLAPFDWFSETILALAIGVDLFLLGGAVAFVDASTEGEALWPDALRSAVYAFLTAVLFGGQVAIVMVLTGNATPPMTLLLLMTVGTSIFLTTFSSPLATWLDRLALAPFPKLRETRRQLRTEAGTLLRRDDALDPRTMPREKFQRVTRRAFSHLGNLPKLASSPLTRLRLVDERLAQKDAPDTTLERAAILRTVLIESTRRLRPRGQGDFGTTDEWRHYNALYFPYVAGLKPYSRRANHEGLNEAERQALEWFRREVPQRTLYNWQTAAARLVARDLRERMEQQVGLDDR